MNKKEWIHYLLLQHENSTSRMHGKTNLSRVRGKKENCIEDWREEILWMGIRIETANLHWFQIWFAPFTLCLANWRKMFSIFSHHITTPLPAEKNLIKRQSQHKIEEITKGKRKNKNIGSLSIARNKLHS
jgi:hypothetical protein